MFFKYDHKYSKYIIMYLITNMVNGNIITIKFDFFFLFEAGFLAVITSVFSVTWSFRNNYNMLIGA